MNHHPKPKGCLNPKLPICICIPPWLIWNPNGPFCWGCWGAWKPKFWFCWGWKPNPGFCCGWKPNPWGWLLGMNFGPGIGTTGLKTLFGGWNPGCWNPGCWNPGCWNPGGLNMGCWGWYPYWGLINCGFICIWGGPPNIICGGGGRSGPPWNIFPNGFCAIWAGGLCWPLAFCFASKSKSFFFSSSEAPLIFLT